MKLLQLDRSGDVPRMKEVEVDIGIAATQTSQKTIPFFISGNFIQAGDAVTLFFPNGLRIDGVTVHTDIAATVVLDVRAVAPENMPSDAGDSICGSAPPELNNECFKSDSVLDGWLRMVPENRVVVAKVTSVSGEVRNITLQFDVVEGVPGFPLLWFTAPSVEVISYTVPSVVYFPSTESEQFTTYNHVEGVTNLKVFFTASPEDNEQFPTYIHVAGAVLTRVLFTATPEDNPQFPAYEQETINPVSLGTLADESKAQWVKYSREITPTGGGGNYTFAVSGLPTGVTASDDGLTLTLAGVPETTGAHVISVQATDRFGGVASASFTLTLTAANRIPVIEYTIPQVFGLGLVSFINGYNFGDTAGTLHVVAVTQEPPQDPLPTPVDITASVTVWSNTELTFALPAGAHEAEMEFYVTAFGQESNVITRKVVTA